MSPPSLNPFHFITILTFLTLQTLVSSSDLHQRYNFFDNHSHQNTNVILLNDAQNTKTLNQTPPTRYFEVTKPIKTPKISPFSYLILQHDFGFTYGHPPVQVKYEPPPNSKVEKYDKIVLEWTATCAGRQFDRIFGVWLGGVELLRSCTAEPRASGIVWNVEKDVTKYYSIFMKNQTLAIYLGNVVDSTYTGVYHVNVTFHFYPAVKDTNLVKDLSGYGDGNWADEIVPVSRTLGLNDGLWFQVVNSSSVQGKEVLIPKNVYRAVLEVYVSPHEKDEFWYSNLPNDYIAANNLTDYPGNGAFREVLVSLDGVVVGAVYPFTVIYTGGVNPLLWRPITGIGSFDLPTYDIELTPFLGNLLDGKNHKIGFSVTNALNVWYINGNLHLWLDSKSDQTYGKLLKHESSSLSFSSKSEFKGTDGNFSIDSQRSISASGWVKSSYGKIKTNWRQKLSFRNRMKIGNDTDLQIVCQLIHIKENVYAKLPFSTYKKNSYKQFPLYMYSNNVDQSDGSYRVESNLTLAFKFKKVRKTGDQIFKTYLNNVQDGQGQIVVKDGLVTSGLGSTQQVYDYECKDSCYFRNISSTNYTVVYDVVEDECSRRERLRTDQLGVINQGLHVQMALVEGYPLN